MWDQVHLYRQAFLPPLFLVLTFGYPTRHGLDLRLLNVYILTFSGLAAMVPHGLLVQLSGLTILHDTGADGQAILRLGVHLAAVTARRSGCVSYRQSSRWLVSSDSRH